MPAFAALDQRCINAIRFLAADAVEKAGVGHLGTPLGAAPMAYVLWDRFLRHDPKHPGWPDRDRFVLSCGHAALLHYALLHLTGYDLALDEFKRFRQFGSQTPGHPEYRITSGIEATTGPLGQGFSIAAGMAMAEAFLARRYNRPGYTLINHHTYALVSDGDMQEGVSSEAASLAGTLGLSNLIAFYDDNDMQIEGPSDLAFHEDVAARFRAYGWRVIDDIDGQDLPAIEAGLRAALAETQRPSLIVVRTRIGYGSPVENTAGAHHGPLGEQALRLTKKRFGWPEEPSFWVPSEVQAHMRAALERGGAAFADWTERLEQYRQAFPAQAKEFERSLAGELPAGWEQNLESALQELPQRIAPRKSSERILQRAAASLPDLIGGAADLGPSTCTYIKHESDFNAQNFAGRNLHFGVREHGMAAAALGMALHGGVRPYAATYLAFSDYLRPSLRLTAMMGQPVIYIFTHDSIAVGQDGPTHQAVEQIMTLRAVPNLVVLRPADSVEVLQAWRIALARRDGPSALLLARQELPALDRIASARTADIRRGGYIVWEPSGAAIDLILLATGSEVQLAMGAARRLQTEGVSARVVSMLSWELFDAQPADYRERVLPSGLQKRISIEAGITCGWERYVGLRGVTLGVNEYGASASADDLYRSFGLTEVRILEQAERLLAWQPSGGLVAP